MPQDVNYSSTTPAADANNQLLKWRADAPSSDPTIVRNVAVEVPQMVGSGAGHQAGLVPDPGATAGTTKFLREDGTWATGAGGGGSYPGTASISVAFNALPGSLNVTMEGTLDWLIWGGSVVLPDFQSNFGASTGTGNGTYRKRDGGLQIWGLAPTGTTTVNSTTGFPSFAVSSSAADARSSSGAISFNFNGTTALFINGANFSGLAFVVPCDSFQRVLRIYVSNGNPYTVRCVSSDGSINSTTVRASSNDQIVITYQGAHDGGRMAVFVGNSNTSTSNIAIAAITLNTV
jgi:hypothetical protein